MELRKRRGAWECVLRMLLVTLACVAAGGTEASSGDGGEYSPTGTVLFSTVGRHHFSWDLYTVTIPDLQAAVPSANVFENLQEKKLTDGNSVNYNGHFVGSKETRMVLDQLHQDGVNVADGSKILLYVSERSGSSRLYFTPFIDSQSPWEISQFEHGSKQEGAGLWGRWRRRQMNENDAPANGGLALEAPLKYDGPYLFDKPSVAGERIVYVSTAEPVEAPRQSSAAVYALNYKTRTTTRLSPEGVAEFSPAVSPSGEWVVAASKERTGVQGEVQELVASLVAYKAEDGSGRVVLAKQGGWPSWADDRTIYFHRVAADGWWSVFRITLPEGHLSGTGEGNIQEERITPPGVHAFTPAASRSGKWVAVATRRSGIRHVEIYDLVTKSFIKVTESMNPDTHHYNPFVSDSGLVGYHRCRGNPDGKARVPRIQHVASPFPGLTLARVDGMFPSVSPDGKQLVVSRDAGDEIQIPGGEDTSGLYVSQANGSGQRKVYSGSVFGMDWDRSRQGVLYASVGPIFSPTKPAKIISVSNLHTGGEVTVKQLTREAEDNNGFPSPSPDGKYLVFRSMRSGYKNLYIMDAVEGEAKYLRRLTNGEWLDTHPKWSPTGEWIAFASNRENPNVGSFGKVAIFLIRPDGTGLRKVVDSDSAGLTVHPLFSHDGKKLLFASDLAGISAEPISEPHQFQPYGEVFMIDIDGSNKQRLTHNFIEDGVPSWSPFVLDPKEFTREGQILQCDYSDTRWLSSEQFRGPGCPMMRLPPVKC